VTLTMLILQLVVGDFGLSYEESKAQFALWSILAAVSISSFYSSYVKKNLVLTNECLLREQ